MGKKSRKKARQGYRKSGFTHAAGAVVTAVDADLF
jgi:UDP-N-acetylenolpyruvoylglucosamine reductase